MAWHVPHLRRLGDGKYLAGKLRPRAVCDAEATSDVPHACRQTGAEGCGATSRPWECCIGRSALDVNFAEL